MSTAFTNNCVSPRARSIKSSVNDAGSSSTAARIPLRLAGMPGIGPIVASAIASSVPDASLFRLGREFAAWLGLLPRQSGTGGKTWLGRISKRGDGYLPRLLVTGALTALTRSKAAKATMFAFCGWDQAGKASSRGPSYRPLRSLIRTRLWIRRHRSGALNCSLGLPQGGEEGGNLGQHAADLAGLAVGAGDGDCDCGLFGVPGLPADGVEQQRPAGDRFGQASSDRPAGRTVTKQECRDFVFGP